MAKKKNRMLDKSNISGSESEVEELLKDLPTETGSDVEQPEDVVIQEEESEEGVTELEPTEEVATEVETTEEEVQVELPENTTEKESEEEVTELEPTEEVKEESVETEDKPQQPKQDRGAILMHKVEFELNNFAEAMDPKKSITKEAAAQWHMTLFLLIKRVLSTEEQSDFNTEWGTLLGFINKNRDGVYSEKWIFRHTDAWSGSASEFNQYRRLIMLILNTANPKGRKAAMSEINFELLVEGLKPVQVNRLGSFYSV